ncbi:MAG: hypothetical protein ABI832_12215 [bacterium]
MTTLYLHIGTHRTATSSIQAFMLDNWETLLERGFLHPLRIPRHFALFNAIFSGLRTVKDVSKELQKRTEKHPHQIDSILLSDEDVCMRPDLTPLADFRNHFDVKVVFALRRQDLWLESWFLQNIKWQWNKSLSHCTLDEFLARSEEFHWAYYDRLLGHVEQLFGHENVLPYAYERAQMPDGPVVAFCDRIGLNNLTGLTPAPHVNSSYSPSIAEFVRCLPFDEAPDKYRARLESAAKSVDLQLPPLAADSSTLLMDHDTRMKILATHAEGNANVARRFFNRENLFLEELPGPDEPLANMALPSDSMTLMRDYVAPMIRGLIQQYVDSPAKV